ncbi:MAG: hypothetical protein GDA49_01705 [Rhodospirillales bacterium]|nr:hypothetical protein [Rhodospirillales bacterium]
MKIVVLLRHPVDRPISLLSLGGFLSLRRAAPAEQPGAHQGRYDQPMAAATRTRLLAFYADEVDELEAIAEPGSRPSMPTVM